MNKLFLSISVVLLLNITARSQNPQFSTFVNPNTINAIERQGEFMWLGTPAGLIKTDLNGTVLQTLTTKDGLPSNIVHDIAITPDGILYAATDNGLSKYLQGVFTNFSIDAEDNRVYRVFVNSGGEVWVRDNYSMYYLEGNTLVEFVSPATGYVIAAAEGPDGTMWFLGNYSEVLRRSPDGTFTKIDVDYPESPNGISINTISVDSDGVVYIPISENGIVKYSDNTWTHIPNSTIGAEARDIKHSASGETWIRSTFPSLANTSGKGLSV